jgi:hypothetical protein
VNGLVADKFSSIPGRNTLSFADQRRIPEVMIHAWEEDTRETYGSGLLVFHVFCDSNGTSESDRAPASQPLLSAFVANLAASYSGRTISNYFYGVQAWHILHGVPWRLNKVEMDTMLRAAEKLTPVASKRKPRRPFTPDFIGALRLHLNLNNPLDGAVFACLTTCFYASARLGEFAVRKLEGFDSSKSVAQKHLSYDQDRNGLKVTVLHLPQTKSSPHGEDVFWAKQNGDTDLVAALENHLRINKPPQEGHLFAYLHQRGSRTEHRPLTKAKFLEQVSKAAKATNLEPLQGHGIQIGFTLEYLLRGVPFDVMKAQGRWAGDSFMLYLRKHAVIMAPYIQATPAINEACIQYTMPPIR